MSIVAVGPTLLLVTLKKKERLCLQEFSQTFLTERHCSSWVILRRLSSSSSSSLLSLFPSWKILNLSLYQLFLCPHFFHDWYKQYTGMNLLCSIIYITAYSKSINYGGGSGWAVYSDTQKSADWLAFSIPSVIAIIFYARWQLFNWTYRKTESITTVAVESIITTKSRHTQLAVSLS